MAIATSKFLGHLLVATDGRTSGDRAVTFAIALARRHGSDIELCYAVDRIAALGESYAGYGNGDTILPILKSLDDTAMALLRSALERVKAAGVDATADIIDGGPPTAIVDCETTKAFDALVMGTEGKQGLQRFLMGSTAGSVLSRSSLPVFVVPPKVDVEHVGFKRVLLAIDGAGAQDAGTEFALDFCGSNGARLIVCNVADSSDAGDTEARALVVAVASKARAKGIPYETIVLHGDAANAVLIAARTRKVDLVVVETHAERSFHRWIFGSCSDTIAESSHVPVVVVPGTRNGRS